MNEQNIMAFIYIGLAAIGGAGIIVGYWTMINKSLKGANKLPNIQDYDEFMRAMRNFLDTRLSHNHMYSANPPGSSLELYEFYYKWMTQRFTGNTWKVAAAAGAAQLIGGGFRHFLLLRWSVYRDCPCFPVFLYHRSCCDLSFYSSVNRQEEDTTRCYRQALREDDHTGPGSLHAERHRGTLPAGV